ncbi:MAG: hypothetical protein WD795_02530 [Woeseia sp.]
MTTSADRRKAAGRLRFVLLGLAAGSCCVLAADEPLPDAAFLEYLGSWEGSDEDWLLFEKAARDPAPSDDNERSDPEPEGEASPESENER